MTYDDIVHNIPNSGSTQLLVKLFGTQIFSILHIAGSGTGPQETLLTIFGAMMHGVALWMFIFVALYIAASGTINQAQSGEFMLQNWNSVWSVLRLSFGVTGVVPFPGTNLVTIQAVVIGIAMLSSSIADITWSKLLESSARAGITAQRTLAPSIDQTKTNAYLNDAYQYVSCAANKIKYSNPEQSLTLENFNPINAGNNPIAASVISVCGSERFHTFLKQASALKPPSVPNLSPAPGSDLISSDTLAKFNNYQKLQYDYITQTTILDFIKNKIWPFYTKNIDVISSGGLDDALSLQWVNITNDFNKILESKIQSVVASNKAIAAKVFTEQSSKYGWISAGNFYRQLAEQQQIVGSAISASLQNSPKYVDLSKQEDLTVADNITHFSVDNSETILKRAESGALTATSKYILDPLGINLLHMGDNSDPLLAMTNFGQKLEGVAEAIFIARQIPALLSWIPVVGDKLNQVFANGFIEVVMGLTALAGLILGTVLPSMPWIIFLFAVLSWLIYVAEMFVAAPFWIVANAAPEGQAFISNVAKKGINNILFITLFPTLAIGGLVASLAISWIGMSLVNHFIYIGFQSLFGIGTFPLTFVGMCFIYVALAWSVMVSSLNLIQEFPRKILNWISLSEPGLSPFENAHESVHGALVGGRISSLASGAINRMGNAESTRAIKSVAKINSRKLTKSTTE